MLPLHLTGRQLLSYLLFSSSVTNPAASGCLWGAPGRPASPAVIPLSPGAAGRGTAPRPTRGRSPGKGVGSRVVPPPRLPSRQTPNFCGAAGTGGGRGWPPGGDRPPRPAPHSLCPLSGRERPELPRGAGGSAPTGARAPQRPPPRVSGPGGAGAAGHRCAPPHPPRRPLAPRGRRKVGGSPLASHRTAPPGPAAALTVVAGDVTGGRGARCQQGEEEADSPEQCPHLTTPHGWCSPSAPRPQPAEAPRPPSGRRGTMPRRPRPPPRRGPVRPG